jgi:valyl-tRNA synthetase
MVLMGLNNTGKIPFDEVFIHPKILDGLGETMSKSKGNGVDPIDIIDKFGPDALTVRPGMARDRNARRSDAGSVRMSALRKADRPNQEESQPATNSIVNIAVASPFSTQWAESPKMSRKLPRGAVVSERFETARNFVNKLWNAARFTLLMNLDDYQPVSIDREHSSPGGPLACQPTSDA